MTRGATVRCGIFLWTTRNVAQTPHLAINQPRRYCTHVETTFAVSTQDENPSRIIAKKLQVSPNKPKLATMRFRPCIDIHAGQVKQIVGSTLCDQQQQQQQQQHDQQDRTSTLVTNFVAKQTADEFARMYKQDALTGGHVIMLGTSEANTQAALSALQAYPNGLQVGGGINADNAAFFIQQGASHVIVTSFIFQNGVLDFDRLKQLTKAVGKERVVIDLSCRKKQSDGRYYVMTDRWQTFTDTWLSKELFDRLAEYCDEFLVHAVDVEGKRCGIQEELVSLLASWSPLPVTYAGGARSFEDLDRVAQIGQGRVDVSIGSALDLFGGEMAYRQVVEWNNNQPAKSN